MDSHVSRRGVVAAAGAFALAGCLGVGGNGGGGSSDSSTRSPQDGAMASAGDIASGPPTSIAALPVQYDFAELRDEVRSGGPPKDGIPAIDDPIFESATKASRWLDDAEIVFGVVGGGEVKAYPQQILVWHEICNDEIGDVPVSVTYCPLTGTAMGFERGPTTFGVSGKLLNSNLVMYDRATDSRWPQMLATAIDGPLEGASLREFRLVWTTWAAWKRAHPETTVLSTETGYIRNYDRDPYGSYNPARGYYVENSTMFTPLDLDDRLRTKHVVVGTRAGETAVAFDLHDLRSDGWLTIEVDGATLHAVFDQRFDTAYVYRTDDSVAVESVSEGTVTLGDGSSHDVAALPFDSAYAYEAMWFAWFGFYPETSLVRGAS